MLKRIGVVAVWLLATLGTASLTYAAVSQAGEAVGDNPAVPVAASDIAARVSTTVAGATTTVATTIGTTTTPTTDGTVGSTTTSIPSATTAAATTTTGAAAHTEWKTVPGVGTVGVSVSGGSVSLVSAQPVAPFYVELERGGPEQVVVKFESEGSEYQVQAEVHQGALVWEVSGGGDESDG
jgi:hypothetical protein